MFLSSSWQCATLWIARVALSIPLSQTWFATVHSSLPCFFVRILYSPGMITEATVFHTCVNYLRTVMRLANFLFFLFLPISQVFCVIFLTWAVISLTLSRMIIRIESSKAPFANMYTSDVRFKTWVAARNTFDFEQASWAAGSIGGSISS
ncbi:hypothetical protein BDY19DRAFT_979752 [Irpex rosettiformis]|uniref:Uncharacterized protein n=1 Tax=Irpex rosettiformis TaxID=378272 RepID=A0ACB8TMQ0_9APHY|nr:hypothetical protein BDY19DRAFT_979752 [Irpex rosettiformis]